MENYQKHIIRLIIREGIANFLMSRTLEDGKINILHHNTLYGAPYSTKPYVVRKYIDKKENVLKIDLKHVFNDNVIINQDKKSQEIIAYTKNNGKQLFTIKLNSDKLKPSFIRFDFISPKEKIEIPITITKEEVERLVIAKKQEMINSGFEDIFR